MDHFNDLQNRKLAELQFFKADWFLLGLHAPWFSMRCDKIKPSYPVNAALASDFA